MSKTLLGIDIGGTGMKGAPVDLAAGDFAQDRTKIATPHPAKPDAVMAVLAEVAAAFDTEGPVGVTFPGVVRRNKTLTAANMDPAWIGLDAGDLMSEALGGRTVHLVNDADAAGVAEMEFGAGRGRDGVVVVATLGTGIGSAVFTDGVLVPNTEFGHLPFLGESIEKWASGKVRENEDLSWHEWAERVDEFLVVVEKLLNPELFVLGGGVSRKGDKWLKYLKRTKAEVVTAELANRAGIVGAAVVAARAEK